MPRKNSKNYESHVSSSPLELETFVVEDPEEKARLEAAMKAAMKDDPFVRRVADTLASLPEEEIPPANEDPSFYDLTADFDIEAVIAEAAAQRKRSSIYVGLDQQATPAKEYTGKSVSYYQVEVTTPTTEGRPPYIAECNDIIEALGMNFAEGNAFKAIWRTCAARQGKSKQGYKDGVYDAEKVVFFGERMIVQAKKDKKGEQE